MYGGGDGGTGDGGGGDGAVKKLFCVNSREICIWRARSFGDVASRASFFFWLYLPIARWLLIVSRVITHNT